MSTNTSESEDEVDHVEYGTVEHADPGPALDGTWNTYMIDSASVAFDWGFEDPPAVVIDRAEETSIGLHRAINVSATGFETRWMVYDTESAAVDGHWAAFGKADRSNRHVPDGSELRERISDAWADAIQRLVIESLHDYDELVRALARIERKSGGRIAVESAGKSNEDRDLFLATVGEGETDVFLVGEQHADEATGCEALLNLLDRIASGGEWVEKLLSELTLHVMPRANPDGVEYGDFRHRFNVDPNAPARNESEGIYTDYDSGEVGWDINRYHWFDWTESELYEHRPDQYPENPVPEAQILVDTIDEIDPLWVADFHNQYYYLTEGDEELITSSLYWPTSPGADSDAQDLSKQLCRSVYDDLDPQCGTTISQFPGSEAQGIARNNYGEQGIACVLIEMRGQTSDYGQLSSRRLIRAGYDIAVSMLVRTADESLFDVDPDAAEEMPERGDRQDVSLNPIENVLTAQSEPLSAKHYDHPH